MFLIGNWWYLTYCKRSFLYLLIHPKIASSLFILIEKLVAVITLSVHGFACPFLLEHVLTITQTKANWPKVQCAYVQWMIGLPKQVVDGLWCQELLPDSANSVNFKNFFFTNMLAVCTLPESLKPMGEAFLTIISVAKTDSWFLLSNEQVSQRRKILLIKVEISK